MLDHNSLSRDDARSSVAAYESLLDLFTLVSFILILAAFIFLARAGGADQTLQSVSSQVAQHGSAVARTLPHDMLLIILESKDSIDNLTVIDGVTGTSTNTTVAINQLASTLNGLIPLLAHVNRVTVSIYEPNQHVSPWMIVGIQRWLANNWKSDYKMYFADIK